MTYPTRPNEFNHASSVFVAPGVARIKTHDGKCWIEFGPMNLTVRYPSDHDLADRPDDYVLWCELGRLRREIEGMWDARGAARQEADDAA